MICWDLTLELVDTTGEHATEVITYQTRRTEDDHHVLSIGRSPIADVVLPRETVERVHCYLIVNDEGYMWIRDPRTPDGTMVSGRRIIDDTARFSTEDVLALGGYVVRLVTPPQRSELTWKIALDVCRRGGASDIRVFHRSQVVIGRVTGADLILESGNISKRHCMVHVDRQGQPWLKDLGSTNGMHVNGRRCDHVKFEIGDKLYAGDWVIKLVENPKLVPI